VDEEEKRGTVVLPGAKLDQVMFGKHSGAEIKFEGAVNTIVGGP